MKRLLIYSVIIGILITLITGFIEFNSWSPDYKNDYETTINGKTITMPILGGCFDSYSISGFPLNYAEMYSGACKGDPNKFNFLNLFIDLVLWSTFSFGILWLINLKFPNIMNKFFWISFSLLLTFLSYRLFLYLPGIIRSFTI